jgi:hypothetical protein
MLPIWLIIQYFRNSSFEKVALWRNKKNVPAIYIRRPQTIQKAFSLYRNIEFGLIICSNKKTIQNEIMIKASKAAEIVLKSCLSKFKNKKIETNKKKATETATNALFAYFDLKTLNR